MEYTALLEKQIIGRLRIDNPWWTLGSVPDFYADMKPRLYLDVFYPLVKDIDLRRATVLMGPRRVGKTVMMYHSIQRLINEGTNPQNIIYINVEAPIYNKIFLETLLHLACEIKSLVDSYLKIKFIASGSAAAELKKKSDESGAGRFTDFHLPPLTFYEYVHLKGYSDLCQIRDYSWSGAVTQIPRAIDITLLNNLFIDYINYGGYPEVVFSERIRENPGQFIRHDIIDKVLLRDLPSLYGISDVQELNSLFTMIAYHSGSQFTYEKLSQESKIPKELLKKYIQYLEAAFLIKVVRRTDDTAKHYQRETQFKIYLTNPSLRCALFEPISEKDEMIGEMVETTVYAQWFPRLGSELRYANWRQGKQQGEVDIVGLDIKSQKPSWAVEIKWSDKFYQHPEELKSLLYFMNKNDLDNALVTSVQEFGEKEVNGAHIHFMPVASYVYIVGYNTLNRTKNHYGL